MAKARPKPKSKPYKEADNSLIAPEGLNPKQALFVLEYLIDMNASQAAIRAGYSEKTAGNIGHELLKKPEIHAALLKAMENRAERTGITADRILNELALIGFSNIQNYNVDDRGQVDLNADTAKPEDIRAVASVKRRRSSGEWGESVEVEYSFWNKLQALTMMGKHVGLFNEKVDVTITGGRAERITNNQKRLEAERARKRSGTKGS